MPVAFFRSLSVSPRSSRFSRSGYDYSAAERSGVTSFLASGVYGVT
jgi:hypothetical protein